MYKLILNLTNDDFRDTLCSYNVKKKKLLHVFSVRAECALEDEVFEDGAETRMECNKCVCACGNWVCTALTCNGEDTHSHTA